MDYLATLFAQVSTWIDEAPPNASRDREAATWGRIAKVSEEAGEVIAAFIGVTGQNPRKGVNACTDDVIKELLDVAVTALCAVEHLTDNKGQSMKLLREHAVFLNQRAHNVVKSDHPEQCGCSGLHL